jgi:exodeoxyribonuclease-3
MRLATWNVNSLRVRMPQLLAWLDRNPLDLIALQELKLTDDEFPLAELAAAGWHALYSGQKTYNGVAILSRGSTPANVVRDIPRFDDLERRVVAATYGELRVIAVYVPNGQRVDSDKYLYKLKWLEALRAWVTEELTVHRHLIVLGDYNIAPEDRDVHDPALWAGSIHVSEPERAALRALQDVGLEDLFRRFEQPPGSFTWWDYRAGAFRRNRGLRIDLMLASKALAERCTGSTIDREPRGWERPTDHAPVLATFATPLMSNSSNP